MYSILKGNLHTTDDFETFDQVDFIPTTNQDKWNRDPLIGIISPTESSLDYRQQAYYYQKPEVGKAPHLIIGKQTDQVIQCVNFNVCSPFFSCPTSWDEFKNKASTISVNIQFENCGKVFKSSDRFLSRLGIEIDPTNVIETEYGYYDSITPYQVDTLFNIFYRLKIDIGLKTILPLHAVSETEYNPVLSDQFMDSVLPTVYRENTNG